MEDILTRSNPWKGADCGRNNCLLCSTKLLTGKNLKQDCTKRSILYEIKCLTCEEEILEKIRDDWKDDEEKIEEMTKKAKIPKYIVESSRSAFERGFEHLDALSNLRSNSHMLKHMVMKHENLDFPKLSGE